MRLPFYIALVSMLIMAHSALAQKQQDSKKIKVSPPVPVTGLVTELGAVRSNTNEDSKDYDMPVYNPGNVDAKMKLWWPSANYQYNMPKPFFNKEKKEKTLSDDSKQR